MIIYILCAVLAVLVTAMLVIYFINDKAQREEIKRLKEKSDLQAVKEFAERLKKRTILYSGINVKYEAITADVIDELLKEYERG